MKLFYPSIVKNKLKHRLHIMIKIYPVLSSLKRIASTDILLILISLVSDDIIVFLKICSINFILLIDEKNILSIFCQQKNQRYR